MASDWLRAKRSACKMPSCKYSLTNHDFNHEFVASSSFANTCMWLTQRRMVQCTFDITQSNKVWDCIVLHIASTWEACNMILIWTHNKRPIARPNGRTMDLSLWVLWDKMTVLQWVSTVKRLLWVKRRQARSPFPISFLDLVQWEMRLLRHCKI